MRWFGFLLVMLGAGGIGFSLVGEYVQRINNLEQIRNMMHYINDAIVYEHATLPEAFRKTALRMNDSFGEFLMKTAKQTEEFSGEDVAFLWKTNASKWKGSMNKNDFREFENCMNQTGFSDAKSQSEALKSYEQRLELTLHKLTQQKEEKCKLYQTVGIMAGLFICILLL